MADNFVSTVTHIPAQWANDVDWLVYDVFQAAHTVADARTALGLRDMALQVKSSVDITGGLIDAVSIGTRTPAVQLISEYMKVQNAPVEPTDVVNYTSMQTWATNTINAAVQTQINALGNMAAQNKNAVSITGGTLDNVAIGSTSAGSGRFQSLRVLSDPVLASDVPNFAWIKANLGVRFDTIGTIASQNSNAVALTGGSIDGVTLGANSAIKNGIFTKLSVVNTPVTSNDVANRQYVVASVQEAISNLSSMAYQSASSVIVTGGTIDGVVIGSNVAASGTFNSVRVRQNQAMVYAQTTSNSLSNKAGFTLYDNDQEVGRLLYVGASNTPGTFVELYARNIPLYVRSGNASMLVSSNNLELSAPVVRAARVLEQRMIIGDGAGREDAKLSVERRTWLRELEADTAFVRDGVRGGVETIANAVGNVFLATAVQSSFVLELADTVNITLDQPNALHVGTIRRVTVVIRQVAGYKMVLWPANVFWTRGAQPNYSEYTADMFDVIELVTWDGGANWLAHSSYPGLLGQTGTAPAPAPSPVVTPPLAGGEPTPPPSTPTPPLAGGAPGGLGGSGKIPPTTIGLSLAGGEFGTIIPGVYETDYKYPSDGELAYWASKGVRFVRLPFRWERVHRHTTTVSENGQTRPNWTDLKQKALDLVEVARLRDFLNVAENVGVAVVLDCHSYGGYLGFQVGDPGSVGSSRASGPPKDVFAEFWRKMAIEFGAHRAVHGYDLMNEPNGMFGAEGSTVGAAVRWYESQQAAINAIRTVDTVSYIYAEGISWGNAHEWVTKNNYFSCRDPYNKLVVSAHQFFDADASGNYVNDYATETGAFATPKNEEGVRRIASWLQWVEDNDYPMANIGEFNAPGNTVSIPDKTAWMDLLEKFIIRCQEKQVSMFFWAGGKRWGDTYQLQMEEYNSIPKPQVELIEDFFTRESSYPQNTVIPGVNGTVANGGVLTCSTGSWTGASSFTYRWFRNGKRTTVTTATYTIGPIDSEARLQCCVSATNVTGTRKAFSTMVTVPTISFTYETEVADWITKVNTNNGSVTTEQAMAVNNAVVSMKTAGIFTKIRRWNPMVGSGLGALRSPLVTTVGAQLEVLHGLTVEDYSKDGVTGGLTTKYIDTGYIPTEVDGGLFAFLKDAVTVTSGSPVIMGLTNFGVHDNEGFFLGSTANSGYNRESFGWRAYETGDMARNSGNQGMRSGFWLGLNNTTDEINRIYRNGALVVSASENSSLGGTPTKSMTVLARRRNTDNSIIDPLPSTARLAGYGVTSGTLTTGEIATLSTIMTTLQTELGR